MAKNTYKKKRKTYKIKKTYKKKTYKKKTYKKRGGGPPDKTPYSRTKKIPCKYASECRRTNKQHFIDFTHPKRYTSDEEIKEFIQECYNSYTKGDIFAHLEHGSIQFLKEGIDANVHISFLFTLLTYIVCNICTLVKHYGKDFLSTMLMRFNEESVDITVKKEDVKMNVQECMTNLGIDYINSIEIYSALNSEFTSSHMKCAW